MNFKALLLVGLLAALSGAAKAVKDTVTHHYAASIFSRWGAEQFWNPEQSWKNKYQDFDQGDKRPRFVLATTVFVSLTDAWHLFDMLHRVLLIAAGIMGGVFAGRSHGYGLRYWIGVWYWFGFILITGGAAFHACYTWLFV